MRIRVSSACSTLHFALSNPLKLRMLPAVVSTCALHFSRNLSNLEKWLQAVVRSRCYTCVSPRMCYGWVGSLSEPTENGARRLVQKPACVAAARYQHFPRSMWLIKRICISPMALARCQTKDGEKSALSRGANGKATRIDARQPEHCAVHHASYEKSSMLSPF